MNGRHDQPRVLYLAFYFPPSRASGVYRARATANHLVSQGFDVTVLTAPLWFIENVSGFADEELSLTVDPRIEIHRPNLNRYHWETDLRNFGRFRSALPTLARRLHERRWATVFPEVYAPWGWSALRKALELHKQRPFDLVLATGNPHASFAAAWALRKLLRIPYVLDYRDAWTLNLFTDRPAFPNGHAAYRWERRIIEGASAVVFVNDALRQWHAERYPAAAEKMMVVPNGWDSDLVQFDLKVKQRAGVPLRFGYIGTLTRNQPIETMVEAFQRMRENSEFRRAELHIYGPLGFFRRSSDTLRRRLADDSAAMDGGSAREFVASGVRLRGEVSKTAIGAAYEDCDVLVFLAAGGRFVTSGKVFEYMASGRPIVSVHSPECAAREVLTGYPLWFDPRSLDPDAIAKVMAEAGRAARDLDPELVSSARQHAARYSRDELLGILSERLRLIVERDPKGRR